MLEPKTYEVEVGASPLTIEYGVLAGLANGAVTVRQGDTVVLVTATMADPREGIDFFPLTVDYEERLYAVGKIPGGFPRREGRPSTDGVLAMRLTDRSLRPLFPKGFRNEIQIVATTLSADREHQPDTLITIGASAAMAISNIPFNGPVSSIRVGRVGGEYIVNPTFQQCDEGDLDIVVAGTLDAIMMVEAGAGIVSEEVVLEAMEIAMEANTAVNTVIQKMADDVEPVKKDYTPAAPNEGAVAAVRGHIEARLEDLVSNAASERSDENKAVRDELVEKFGEEFTLKELAEALNNVIKGALRKRVLDDGRRADGREVTEIRPLTIAAGVLPRTHGTGLFQRGETQVLSVATLAGLGLVQRLDTLSPDETKRYMHHYNFPPYSVGEARPMRGAGRREIGHGALAERALLPVVPPEDEFPYALRVVSEVMSSNGSTSMASVCGSSLSLMDAGVPLKAPVAGIAMGLMMGEDGNYKVLTDIAGQEDFMGDMDFKVAGTREGITALQMDIKIAGVARELLEAALAQAKDAREFILDQMSEVITEPREGVSEFAPKVYIIKIDPEKIGTVIGPGGRVIRRIQEDSGGASVDVQEDGSIFVGAVDDEVAKKALRMIEGLTKEIQVGDVYKGPVTRVLNFGAFVELLPGKDGLVHISELAEERVERVEDIVSVGDEIEVVVTEIDNLGRLNLSRRALLAGSGPPTPASGDSSRPRREDRPRRDRDGDRPRDRSRGPRHRDREEPRAEAVDDAPADEEEFIEESGDREESRPDRDQRPAAREAQDFDDSDDDFEEDRDEQSDSDERESRDDEPRPERRPRDERSDRDDADRPQRRRRRRRSGGGDGGGNRSRGDLQGEPSGESQPRDNTMRGGGRGSGGGGRRDGGGYGGGRSAPPQRGASRGWTRRSDASEGTPPPPPPPPRRGLGGGAQYDD